jgi:hypothetical protein
VETADQRERRIRDARARTARQLVEATANGKAPLSHRQAEDRVNRAVNRGDAIRRDEP